MTIESQNNCYLTEKEVHLLMDLVCDEIVRCDLLSAADDDLQELLKKLHKISF
jgi:hypothetical protein